MSPILFLAFIILLLFIIYDYCTARPTKNSPPGPLRFPILGSYTQMLLENYHFPYRVLSKFSERYNSPIISVYLGSRCVIVANTYETCRELFNRPEFQNRPDNFPLRVRAGGKRLGLFFNDGPDWLHQKRFSLRELRDFGLGRRSEEFEASLLDGIKDMIEVMKEKTRTDTSLIIPDTFYSTIINSSVQLLTGRRLFGEELRYLEKFMHDTLNFIRSAVPIGGVLAFIPWIRHFFPNYVGYNGILKYNGAMQEFSEQLIKWCKEDHEKGLRRGFIDVYNNNQETVDYFSDDQLRMICTDVMLASNAVTQVISFSLMYLAADPDLQRRCQRQVDDVVGRGRQPTLDDRENLPLVEATLRESLRWPVLAPVSIPHRASEDTTFFGYDIPAGTLMISNLYAMHRDKSVFDQPDKFYPERYLDCNGKLVKKDYALPFGLGRRVCVGETLARQNMFLALSSILQNFTVEPDSPIDFNLIKPGIIANLPDNYKMKFIARE